MLKNKNEFRILTFLILIVALVLPYFAMAQDPDAGPDAPIDGGVSLLLAAGTAYGVKKYRSRKRKQYDKNDLG